MTVREMKIAKLYLATLGRMPDEAGLDYWVNSDMTIAQIAESFFDQDETKKLYPDPNNYDKFIKAVYNNLFDRVPDSAGLEYWKHELSNGKIAKNMFILSVINGAVKEDSQILENKILNEPFAVIDTVKNHTLLSRSLQKTDDMKNLSKYMDSINKVSNKKSGLDMIKLFKNTDEVNAIKDGHSWKKHNLTYTFNKKIPSEYNNYDKKYTNGWKPFNDHEKDLVRGIFSNIEKFANVTFTEVEEGGDIRFNHVDMPSTIDGFTKSISKTSLSGDVWISNYVPKDGDNPGTARYFTYLHEIGHSLGLKHPFSGNLILPDTLDDTNHTVMAYKKRGDKAFLLNQNELDKNSFYYKTILPDTYEAYDIEAIQSIYGPKLEGSYDGDTSYNYSNLFKDRKHAVIWDTSGNDTIDLSLTTHPDFIDMRSGQYSSVDIHSFKEQIDDAVKFFIQKGYTEEAAQSWGDNLYNSYSDKERIYTGDNTLSIIKGTVIENVITGSANDIVIDNEYDNIILTGLGDDKILIKSGGFDEVNGGAGHDTLVFDFNSYDANISKLNDGRYIVDASEKYNSVVVVDNIESIEFHDTVLDLI